jgi:hypothetical protein
VARAAGAAAQYSIFVRRSSTALTKLMAQDQSLRVLPEMTMGRSECKVSNHLVSLLVFCASNVSFKFEQQAKVHQLPRGANFHWQADAAYHTNGRPSTDVALSILQTIPRTKCQMGIEI